MLKLADIDWIDEREGAEFGGRPVESVLGPQGDGVTVELCHEGREDRWPSINVYAEGESGAEAGPRLWAWLVEVYGVDGDMASEMASMAESV